MEPIGIFACVRKSWLCSVWAHWPWLRERSDRSSGRAV